MNKEMLNRITPVIKNEVTDSEHILTLSGVVAKDSIFDYDGDLINMKTISDSLESIGNRKLLIKLNSYGGDAFEGIEIYNYLKSLKNKVVVEVTSIAASAASIIAMGADEIRMSNGSQLMIHEASTFAVGTKSEMQKTLNALKSMDNSIVDIYHERTGLDKTEILQLMEEETWFTSEEAVKHKFADNVITNKGGDNVAKHTKNDIAKRIVAMLNEEDLDEVEETEVEEVDYSKQIKDIERRLDALEKRVNETVEETTENNSSRFFF
nr:MAG TPA_asm: Putative ATP dependent Clp protease [Caudoviricetes sp.]